MARTTISIPDELKAAMDALVDVNWSATAAEAFRTQIERHNVRRQQLEGTKMIVAIERLKASREAYLAEAEKRGRDAGIEWAQESAEYGELKELADNWEQMETTETDDAHGAPGNFLGLIGRVGNRIDINDFWLELNNDVESDKYSHLFWDGFAKGALEVFEQLED